MTSGRQVEDGGVLYDEIEADDEDIVELVFNPPG